MKAVVDRLDSVFAVLIFVEDNEIRVNIPRTFLPHDCEEGDIITAIFERDEAATLEAKRCASDFIETLVRGT